MKKLLLSAAAMAAFSLTAQTTLFQDNFESGGGNWTLNGGTGLNQWIINSEYLAAAATFGFVPDTPQEPAGISGSPYSNYLHIHSTQAVSLFGIVNANFDTGSTSNQSARMNTGVSTTGMSSVTVSFWYLCAGMSNVSYGTLEYSVNGGANWTVAGTYVNVGAWTQESVSLPAWDNQADFRIRFTWQNGAGGNDPSFAVDDVLITAVNGGGSTTLTTGTSLTPTSWCYNATQNINVDFTSTGTFTAGNIYSAQLSDATGSFAAPTAIGTLTSTANTGTINATIPTGTAVGSGYRIRVVSSTPATTGTDNGVDLTINALPTVSLGTFSEVCVYADPFTLTGGSPAGGSFSGTGVTLNVFNPNPAGVGSHVITYSYTDGNGCSGTAQQNISVSACAGIEELNNTYLIYPNPATSGFQISGAEDISRVVVLDMSGREVLSFDKMETYDVSDLSEGNYLVQVYTDNSMELHKLQIRK